MGAIARQPTGQHHAMYMRVKFEFLTPGVQHAEEANFCAKMFGIAGNFEECFCSGSEQEIVDDFLVLQNQRSQMTRKREDHMHVLRRKKFPATLLQPTFASARLTLWAVPISTGNGELPITCIMGSFFLRGAAQQKGMSYTGPRPLDSPLRLGLQKS